MKTRVLIIEDNEYKAFTTKQVLEAQLRLAVTLADVDTVPDLAQASLDFAPTMVLVKPDGGVLDVVERLRRRQANRRNTVIHIITVADALDEDVARRLRAAFAQDHRSRPDREAAAA